MAKSQILELNITGGAFIAEQTEEISENITLIVPPSCEAVFVENGAVLGVFGEGKHDFTEKKGFFARLFGKRNTVISHIYCVNKSVPILGYWGTPSRIEFRERETGIPVSAGLCGTYRVFVDNTLKLLKNLLGLGKALDADAIADYYGSEISSVVRDRFFKLVTGGDIPFFELAGNLSELAALIRGDVDKILIDAGLKTAAFTVDSVGMDDDVKKLVRDYALKAYNKKMTADERAEVEREKNLRDERAHERELWERSEAHARAMRQDEIALEKARAEKSKEPERKEGGFCPNCGKRNDGNTKFCPECGAPLKVVCVCGAVVPPGSKFCPECGRSLTPKQ